MSNDPMSPAIANKTLPGAIQTLHGLRDQLTLALSTLEQNTDRVTAWLKAQHDEILLTHHLLSRHMNQNDAKALASTLGKLTANDPIRDVIGFLLSDGVFLQKAIDQFGRDHAVIKALKAIPAGLPARLIEEVPEIVIDQEFGDKIARNAEAVEKVPTAPTPTPKKAGGIGSMFKSKAAREAEEAEVRAHQLLSEWRQLHRELLDLQSDRHYFVDSFMDWVGENLAPATAGGNIDAVLLRYRHPAYMLQQAETDYREVMDTRTRQIMEEARAYTALATKLDKQDIVGFGSHLPLIYPEPDNKAAAHLRALLFRDYNATGLTDLALDHAQKPEDRLYLLKAAQAYDGRLAKGAFKDFARVYRTILQQVVKKELPVEALRIAIKSLGDDGLLIAHNRDTIPTLLKHFGGDDALLIDALSAVIGESSAARAFVDLRRALLDRNDDAIKDIFDSIATDQVLAGKVEALRQLYMPGDWLELFAEMAAGHADKLYGLIIRGAMARLGTNLAEPGKLTALLKTTFLPQMDKTPPGGIAYLVALARPNLNKDNYAQWRQDLGGADGLLCRAATAPHMNDENRLKVLAGLLAPLPTVTQKAALLLEAAEYLPARDADAAALLRDAAYTISGDATVLPDGTLFAHYDQIVNIWYENEDGGAVKYVVEGQQWSLPARMDRPEAAALLKIIAAHTPALQRESGGLFNPLLAERVGFEADGSTTLYLEQDFIKINVDAAARAELQKHPVLVHARQGDAAIGFNPASILSILPQANGWTVITRKGQSHDVDQLQLPKGQTPLLKAANGWFNPDCAGYLALDTAKRTIRIVCAGPFFAETLARLSAEAEAAGHAMDPGYVQDEKFVLSAGSAREAAALAEDLSARDSLIHTEAMPGFYFSLDTMSYLTFKQRGEHMHLVHGARYWTINQARRIDPATPEDLPHALAKAVKKHSRALVIAQKDAPPAIIDAQAVLQAYYNPDSGLLAMIMPHENLSLPVTPDTAKKVLTALDARPENISSLETDNSISEVFNYGRATRISFDDSSASIKIGVDRRQIAVNLDKKEFLRWTNELAEERRGLQASKRLSDHAAKQFWGDATSRTLLPKFEDPRKPADVDTNLAALKRARTAGYTYLSNTYEPIYARLNKNTKIYKKPRF